MQVGKYQLVRKLASGGMAEVYLAKAAGPMGFEKTLVLKRILPHLADDPAFVEMFLGEAKLAAQLDHPNIVQVFDFGEADDSYFLAMEYIDGPTLRRVMKRAAEQGQALPPAICARIVAAAAEGLEFAHQFSDPVSGELLGLIHRDVSPDNILLSRKGSVKVVDFGIAKVAGQGHRTQTGVVKGKIAYMPPEQVQAQPLDRRVDVYALGIVLYELLTGRRPFDASTDVGMMQAILFQPFVPVVQRRPDVPVALQKVLARVLAKDREERYPDCRSLQADLERYVMSVGEPVGAYEIARFVEQLTAEGAKGPALTPAPSASQGLAAAAVVSAGTQSLPDRRGTGKPRVGSEGGRAKRENSMSAPLESGESGPADRATVPTLRTPVPSPALAETMRQERSAKRTLPPIPPPPPDSMDGPTQRDPDDGVPTASGRISARTEEAEAQEGTTSPSVSAQMPRARRGVGGLVAGAAALFVVGGAVVLWAAGRDGGGEGTSGNVGAPEKIVPPPVAPLRGPVVETPKLEPAIAADPSGPATVVPTPPANTETKPVANKPSPAGSSKNGGLSDPFSSTGEPAVQSAKTTVPPVAQRSSDASVKSVRPVEQVTLEFRIRPYGMVSVDGKVLGMTPVAPIKVPVGKHTIRVVNKDLAKDVSETFVAKTGQANIFKLNLEAE